jgi:hypothetical protein
MYLTPPTTEAIPLICSHPKIGCIITPDSDRPNMYDLSKFPKWAADNGCFAAGDRFDDNRYIYWLMSLRRYASNCLFVTAPDVLLDPVKTWRRSSDWLGFIRTTGFPAALVAQDGIENENIDWGRFDALFVGGSTAWKMSSAVSELIRRAKEEGKLVHAGRVNSAKRYEHFAGLGVDSVDGTFVCYGPSKNIPKVLRWVDKTSTQLSIFSQGGIAAQ